MPKPQNIFLINTPLIVALQNTLMVLINYLFRDYHQISSFWDNLFYPFSGVIYAKKELRERCKKELREGCKNKKSLKTTVVVLSFMTLEIITRSKVPKPSA